MKGNALVKYAEFPSRPVRRLTGSYERAVLSSAGQVIMTNCLSGRTLLLPPSYDFHCSSSLYTFLPDHVVYVTVFVYIYIYICSNLYCLYYEIYCFTPSMCHRWFYVILCDSIFIFCFGAYSKLDNFC